MAQVIAGISFPLRLNELNIDDLLDGSITSKSATSLVINLGDGSTETFTGTGFVYDGFGNPAGGTITGIQERYNNQTTFQVTGLEVPVSQFVSWVQSNATTTALTSMFSGNDELTGSQFDDYLLGYGGHDYLFGGEGSDTLKGGGGNDHIYGRSTAGADGRDYLYGDEGSDYLQGNAGNDVIYAGDGSDRAQGGRDNDYIQGENGNDTLNGNIGDDTVSGGADNDSLRGGQGNDRVDGGFGDDVVLGDLGIDTLSGGVGADIFVFSGSSSLIIDGQTDRVLDFTNGVDRFSLGFAPTEILTGAAQSTAAAGLIAAQQAADASAGDGEVVALAVGSDTYLFYASNGGATINSAVAFTGNVLGAIDLTDFTIYSTT